MGDIKEMAMEILNKITKVEEAVENIQEGTTETQEMVGRNLKSELAEGNKEASEGQSGEKCEERKPPQNSRCIHT